MRYFALRSFEKKFDSYAPAEQEIIEATLKEVRNYLDKGEASFGLRIKQFSPRLYEARINIRLRIAFFREKDSVKFFCLGTHDDIKDCLKRFKLG